MYVYKCEVGEGGIINLVPVIISSEDEVINGGCKFGGFEREIRKRFHLWFNHLELVIGIFVCVLIQNF